MMVSTISCQNLIMFDGKLYQKTMTIGKIDADKIIEQKHKKLYSIYFSKI